jgi:hypothetical protein
MSEEVQAVEANPLNDMIQHALDQNFNKANELFNDMISVKMADVLDQEKARLADEIYNGAEPEEDDFDDEQLELDLEDDAEGDMEETSDEESADDETDDEAEIYDEAEEEEVET